MRFPFRALECFRFGNGAIDRDKIVKYFFLYVQSIISRAGEENKMDECTYLRRNKEGITTDTSEV